MKSTVFLLGAASLLALSACNSDKPAAAVAEPAAKEAVEATVNGVAITKKRVDMIAQQSGAQAEMPEARKDIVDKLSMQMVVADEAVKKGLDKSADVIEQTSFVKQSVLAAAYVQDYMKSNPVTDEMLKAEYERLKSTVSGNEYKARHILVEKESEAKEIIAKLKKDPAVFEKLATEKSKDPGSKVKGGDLGWFDPRQMVPEFGAAVVKLEKGKFTEEPVKTSFGYHVILLEDSRAIEPPAFEEVKANLTQQLQQQNLMKHLNELKAKAKIEMVAAPAPAAAPAAAPEAAPAAAPAAEAGK